MPTATCLCGGVKFEVRGPFGDIRYCHCTQCRKATGSAFSANAKISIDNWQILEGKEQITEFEQKTGIFRAFCRKCGSPVYARLASEPGNIQVRVGSFIDAEDVNVVAHVWVSSKASWYDIDDLLPCYLEGFDA